MMFDFTLFRLGCSQAVRQWFLVPPCVGSNPATPMQLKIEYGISESLFENGERGSKIRE